MGDNFLENEPSTSSYCLKSWNKYELQNANLCLEFPVDEFAQCNDLPKPADSPDSLEDELPEPDEMIHHTENVGDLGDALNGTNLVDIDNVLTSILEQFEDWLKGPDGGKTDDQCACQCMRQIQLILVTIDPDQPKVVNHWTKQFYETTG